jgi:hypothetical protein
VIVSGRYDEGVRRRPALSESVVKTLFAWSGNRCAFIDPDNGRGCEEKLTDPAWPRVKARVSHIRGLNVGSARHAELPPGELNAFENLILLCPNHHALVDDLEPERFPVDALEAMKARSMVDPAAAGWAPGDAELRRVARLLLAAMGALPGQDEDEAPDEPAFDDATYSRIRPGQVVAETLGDKLWLYNQGVSPVYAVRALPEWPPDRGEGIFVRFLDVRIPRLEPDAARAVASLLVDLSKERREPIFEPGKTTASVVRPGPEWALPIRVEWRDADTNLHGYTVDLLDLG